MQHRFIWQRSSAASSSHLMLLLLAAICSFLHTCTIDKIGHTTFRVRSWLNAKTNLMSRQRTIKLINPSSKSFIAKKYPLLSISYMHRLAAIYHGSNVGKTTWKAGCINRYAETDIPHEKYNCSNSQIAQQLIRLASSLKSLVHVIWT